VELAKALVLQRGKADCALVDCLTLWINNLLLRRDENDVAHKVEELVKILPALDFRIVLVSNEVGWGIVPDRPLARKFRDLAGWANQRIAEAADEVVLMVAGNPIIVKKEATCS
jgi:adenosylcobinamide kinase/adenosylcobinamide-phosphate guanylyltransferase